MIRQFTHFYDNLKIVLIFDPDPKIAMRLKSANYKSY